MRLSRLVVTEKCEERLLLYPKVQLLCLVLTIQDNKTSADQKTMCKNHTMSSLESKVKKGMAQGAVLSSLWPIHLKKLPCGIHIMMYADDTCTWSVSNSHCTTLQWLQKATTNFSHYLAHRGVQLTPEESLHGFYTEAHEKITIDTRWVCSSLCAIPNVSWCGNWQKRLSWQLQGDKLCGCTSAILQVLRYKAEIMLGQWLPLCGAPT